MTNNSLNLPYPINWDNKIPRIYVLCPTPEGNEHGHWIDAICEREMQINIQHILEKSPFPNLRMFKFTSTQNFEGIEIKSSMLTSRIAELGQGVLKHGMAFACYTRLYEHCSFSNILESFTNEYQGTYSSVEYFVELTVGHKLSELKLIEIIEAWFNSEKKIYHQIFNKYENAVYIYKLVDNQPTRW